jgi:RNA-splicing ligase RtcB
MPDVHSGAGCVIGTTMTITDKIVPNLTGVDLGCGIHVANLVSAHIDFPALDAFIRDNIPMGRDIYNEPQYNMSEEIQSLKCYRELRDAKKFNRAIGTLGGGNHFIEINEDSDGCKYLVIHSGSRNLGHQVATYYQKQAIEYACGLNDEYETIREEIIRSYKEKGDKDKIQDALKKLKESYKVNTGLNQDLCYLEGKVMQDYLHDMRIVQEYASINRRVMANKILDFLLVDKSKHERFETIHNYIDLDNMILRKGAISAQRDEMVIIPINMRDGSILAYGKGNPDWNYSAPHGAGRLFSRSKAREEIGLEEFELSMAGIYTTSVGRDTIDESPMAYKPMQEIIDNIGDTVFIIDIIKPLYNIKAGGD